MSTIDKTALRTWAEKGHIAQPKDVIALLDHIAALEARLAAAEGDAGRYRWLVSARTEDDAAACVVNGPPPVLPQDEVISTLGSWYFHKELADSLIDAAMKGATNGPQES